MRIDQESSLVKKFEKKLKKSSEPNPDVFAKREWTQLEDQQLREAVRKHGTHNWAVMCQDRLFLEMIANHTEEDVKARWRHQQRQIAAYRKQRAGRREPLTATVSSLSSSLGRSRAVDPDSVDPVRELRLKQTLQREADKRANLERGLRAEQAVRFEAEKLIATQLRERRKMEKQLKQYESSLKALVSTLLLSLVCSSPAIERRGSGEWPLGPIHIPLASIRSTGRIYWPKQHTRQRCSG